MPKSAGGMAALILPRDPGGDDVIELTERLEVPGRAARRWAAGHMPLPDVDIIDRRRPAFHWRVREGELGELRHRIEALEIGSWLERRRHGEIAQPIVAAVVTSDRGVLVGKRRDNKPPWTFIAGEQEPAERPVRTGCQLGQPSVSR
jgi:hypothetical protein